jgi:ABC-type nitrate/sulfonate/bicarbonate transport system ATPase subunit
MTAPFASTAPPHRAGATPPAPARIELRNVSKRFARPGKSAQPLTVLSDVSLAIPEGAFVSLIGASGCGKTTMLRMMSGLVPYDEGSIQINGQLVRGIPPSIGFVFQEPALLPWRTVRHNVAFALQQHPMSRQELEDRVSEKLLLANLQDFGDYYPRMLSGGMQQRVGLARALVGDPDVLFMDEPLSALDAFTRRRLQQDIADIIASASATTVLVTHDVDEAIFFSDRIIVMGTPPASIREVVDVPLPRPRRHVDLLQNPVVAEIRDHVLGTVLGLA